MRFSLATLVFLVLWIGAVMAVWLRREPWNFSGTREATTFDSQREFPISPDQTRTAIWDCNETGFYICRKSATDDIDISQNLLYHTLTNRITGNLFPIRFIDDNTLELIRTPDEDNAKEFIVVFHRRFPGMVVGSFLPARSLAGDRAERVADLAHGESATPPEFCGAIPLNCAS
jgi:hypothetical protein